MCKQKSEKKKITSGCELETVFSILCLAYCASNLNMHACFSLAHVKIVAISVLGRAVFTTMFMVVETLFNPILSNSFGLTEKWVSYISYALVIPAIVGAFAA